jgi:hypothetical protein
MAYIPTFGTWHKNQVPKHGIKTMDRIVAIWRSRAREDWTANSGPFGIPSKSRPRKAPQNHRSGKPLILFGLLVSAVGLEPTTL